MDKYMNIDRYDIEEKFTAHEPKPEDAERYTTINEAARVFARVIAENTHPGAETDNAIKAIQEAVLWAREAVLLTPDGAGFSSVPKAPDYIGITDTGHEFRLLDHDNRWSRAANDADYWVITSPKNA